MRVLVTPDELSAEGVLKRTAEDGAGEVLVAETAQGPRAYANACPHMGVAVDGPGETFIRLRDHLSCPVHHALFDLTTGLCVWGPCKGRSLAPVELVLRA